MAWDKTLLEASYNGIVFDIVKTDDSAEHVIVEHSYPYVDGSDIESMGRGARRISVEAVFYGDDYEERLQWFIDGLDLAGNAEFVHPVFGSFKNTKAARYAVHHDADNPDFATVTIEFIESTTAAPFFSRQFASQKAAAVAQHGAAATDAAAGKVAAVVDQLVATKSPSFFDKLRTAMTGPLLALTSGIAAVLSGLDVLSYARAWANDISAMVGSLLDIRDWAKQLESDWASIQSSLNSFSIFSTPSSDAPPPITSGNVPTEQQAVAAVAATIRVNTAVGLANAASYVFAAESATPMLTPTTIEAIVNIARRNLASTIEQVRAIYGIEDSRPITEALKDQGLALQEAARAVIVARPPLIQRVVEAPGNMRLLAHLWYGDHARAQELYRLNGARSPFVNTGDSVNAYAS